MGRRRLFIAIAGAIALIAGVLASGVTAVGAPACTKTWNHGALTDNFTDAANWAPVGVPGASDHVCVPTSGGGTQVVYASGTTTIASIQHSAGGDLPLVITGGA